MAKSTSRIFLSSDKKVYLKKKELIFLCKGEFFVISFLPFSSKKESIFNLKPNQERYFGVKAQKHSVVPQFNTLMRKIQQNFSLVEKVFYEILYLRGPGFYARVEPSFIVLFVGFSHPISVALPKDVHVLNYNSDKTAKTTLVLKSKNLEYLKNFCSRIKLSKSLDFHKKKGIFSRRYIFETEINK